MGVITVMADVDAEGMVHLDVPSPVKRGRVRVRVDIRPATVIPRPGTAADLLASPLWGAWRDRSDIADSVALASDLRRRGEIRGGR